MQNLQQVFEGIGGEFITPLEEMKARLAKIKLFLFDWDGVFNNGVKGVEGGSVFAEPDSMGINLLRFSYWLLNDRQQPLVGIVTGSMNETSLTFAKREHFHLSLRHYKNKGEARAQIKEIYDCADEEIAFFFDDVLDLPIVKICGLALMVRRKGNPLFNQYIKEKALADYISGNNGDSFAIREITELLIGLNGNFTEVIDKRANFSKEYADYWQSRNQIKGTFLVKQ